MTNNQAMIEWIATEVMGWKRVQRRSGFIVYTKKRKFICAYADFNPFENHQQAFDALHEWLAVDTNRKYQLEYSSPSKKTRVHLWGHLPQGVTEAYGDDALAAICHAVCRASGWVE